MTRSVARSLCDSWASCLCCSVLQSSALSILPITVNQRMDLH